MIFVDGVREKPLALPVIGAAPLVAGGVDPGVMGGCPPILKLLTVLILCFLTIKHGCAYFVKEFFLLFA